MKESSRTKKFFNTEAGWIDIGLTTKIECRLEQQQTSCISSESKNEVPYEEPMTRKTIANCVRYWDGVKNKFKFNHLYRSRILKIKQDELKSAIGDKKKITQLFETQGDIKAQYVNTSKYRENRGKGIQDELNGKQIEVMEEEEEEETMVKLEEPIEEESDIQDVDVLEEIKKCFIKSLVQTINSLDQSKEHSKSQENSNEIVHDSDQCLDRDDREFNKLFTVPECIQPIIKEESALEPLPTQFETCMKELHDLEKPEEIKEEDQIEESVMEEEDPWCKFERYQKEEYGFAEALCPPEGNMQDKDNIIDIDNMYRNVLNNFFDKEIRIKGIKIKIKQLLGTNNISYIKENIKSMDLTLRGENETFLKGLDIRWENAKEDYEVEIMKQVLETLVGEWTVIGTFLKNLAHAQSAKKDRISTTQLINNTSMVHNIHNTIEEMLKENDENNETNTRDLKVELNYLKSSTTKKKNPKDQPQNLMTMSFRQKYQNNDAQNKKNPTTVTKKELIFGPQIRSIDLPSENASIINECTCIKELEEGNLDNNVEKAEHLKTYHRGLVELISGGKYDGSWNHLGMEGCGIYISPGGTMIEGQMKNGVLCGPGTVYLPNGIVMTGHFDEGKFLLPKIKFGDDIVYKEKNWDYLEDMNSRPEKDQKPIIDREIPLGHYDTGEGFYNPLTKLLYHPKTMFPIRSVSLREEKWILSMCRGAIPQCVSFDEHLYEKTNVKEKWNRQKYSGDLVQEIDFEDECEIIKQIYTEKDSKNQWSSPDRDLQVDEKSKPIEEIWNSLREIVKAQQAKVGVPFNHEKVYEYTCSDERKQKDRQILQ